MRENAWTIRHHTVSDHILFSLFFPRWLCLLASICLLTTPLPALLCPFNRLIAENSLWKAIICVGMLVCALSAAFKQIPFFRQCQCVSRYFLFCSSWFAAHSTHSRLRSAVPHIRNQCDCHTLCMPKLSQCIWESERFSVWWEEARYTHFQHNSKDDVEPKRSHSHSESDYFGKNHFFV